MPRPNQPYTFITLVLALLTSFAVGAAYAQEKDSWIEASTENFTVRSALSEKKTVEMLYHLELFKAAVSGLTRIDTSKGAIPTEILVLESTRDLMQFGFDSNYVGAFIPSVRSNLILMRDSRSADEANVIQHEYVHFLVRNQGSTNYPRWFDEGYAEYLGSAELERGKYKIGTFPDTRLSALKYLDWISMRKIIDPHDYEEWADDQKAMFYLQAWALVHYMRSTPEINSSFGADMVEYTNLMVSGMNSVTAFEQAFDQDVDRLGVQVKKYVERGSFGYLSIEPDQLVSEFNPQIIDLTAEQISLSLADAALRRGKFEKAEYWYDIAKNDEQLRPRAESGLGDLQKFQGNHEEARAHYELAIELDPNDPILQLDFAEYWHELANEKEDSAEAYFGMARTHYFQAWKLDDTLPEIYAQNGLTYLELGDDFEKAVELLEEAQYLLPSYIPNYAALAAAYMEVERYEDAIDAARTVLAWSHDSSGVAAYAQRIIQAAEQALAAMEG